MGRRLEFGDPTYRRVCAFTLVELLLTLVLLLLLFGAVVFNYSTLSHGARLDHGAEQLETLFRFARSQAAASGRQVRVVFANPGLGLAGGSPAPSNPTHSPSDTTRDSIPARYPDGRGTNAPLEVVWEPDPNGAPGKFEPLNEAQPFVDGILEALEVVEVHLPSPERVPSKWGWNGYSAVADKMTHSVDANPAHPVSSLPSNAADFANGPIQVGFFPDGSSDSVELVLGAIDDDDPRKMILSLSGVTGKITRKTVELDADGRPLEEANSGEHEATDAIESATERDPSSGGPIGQPAPP